MLSTQTQHSNKTETESDHRTLNSNAYREGAEREKSSFVTKKKITNEGARTY